MGGSILSLLKQGWTKLEIVSFCPTPAFVDIVHHLHIMPDLVIQAAMMGYLCVNHDLGSWELYEDIYHHFLQSSF